MLGIVVTSEEVNYLVYRYLLEAGFAHSAFTFGQESFIGLHGNAGSGAVKPADVAPGLLISLLQRGLQYTALEAHIGEDGSERPCTQSFSLLREHRCSEPVDVTDTATAAAAMSELTVTATSNTPDTPLQTSIASAALALQNASVMATNAVYGQGTSISNAAASDTTSIVSSALSAGSHKKKKKESSSSGVQISAVATVTSAPVTATTPASATDFAETDVVELKGHDSEVIGCAWNPMQSVLASASVDSTVRLWSFPTGAALYAVNPRTVNRSARTLVHVLMRNPEQSSDVTCLEWRGDGTLLATGCYDGKARLWTASGDLVKTLQRHTGPLFALKWSPGANGPSTGGRYLLTGGIDGCAIVWDPEGGHPRFQLHDHQGACLDVDWRANSGGAMFVTCGSDRMIHFYDLALATEGADSNADAEADAKTHSSLRPAATLTGHEDEVNTLQWSPDGLLLASCSDDRTVRVWAVTEEDGGRAWSWKSVCVLTGHGKEVYTLDWSPQGDLLATASFDTTVRLWTPATPDVPSRVLARHTQPVYAVAFSPCGRFLATGSLDETLLVWRVESGEVVRSFPGGRGGVFSICWQRAVFNNDETGTDVAPMRLAASYSSGVVVVFDFYVPIAEEGIVTESAESMMVVDEVSDAVPQAAMMDQS